RDRNVNGVQTCALPIYFSPHTIVMEKASGSKLFDVDGEEYIDYSLCYGALITGHGHEQITSATTKYMESIGTTIFGTPHRLEIRSEERRVGKEKGRDRW